MNGLKVILFAALGVAVALPIGAYMGKIEPDRPTFVEKPNPGHEVLPARLSRAYFTYKEKPHYLPLKEAFGNFVDPIGRTKGRYDPNLKGKPEARIGFIGCLTGPAKDYSLNMLKGVEMAVEEANAAGGYKGPEGTMPFAIYPHNDFANMGMDGKVWVKSIYDDQVLGILGSMASDTTHVGIRVSLKAETPSITSISTDPTITQVNTHWSFRALADDWAQGRAMAKLIFDDMKLKKIAILQQNNRYGRMGQAEIERVANRLGYPVKVNLKFEGAATDFSPQLKIVKEYDPEAIVIWGLYAPAARITKQAKAMGITAQIFGADGLVSDTYIEMAGRDAEGVIVTQPYDSTSDYPINKDFIKRYVAKYGREPDSFSAHGYDVAWVMINAIRKAGLNRALIRDALTETDYHGVTGHISFDHMNNDTRKVIFAKVVGGKFVPLYRLAEAQATAKGF